MATKTPAWAERFTSVSEHLSVQFNLVFTGDKALKANSIYWPKGFRHFKDGDGVREPVCKLYFLGSPTGNGGDVYYDYATESHPDKISVTEDYCEWTWMRSENCRAVCGPRPVPRQYLEKISENVDLDKAETSCWGFGRPNLYKPHAPVHQLLSGAVVDYSPSGTPSNRADWKFQPVFIKVVPHSGPLTLGSETRSNVGGEPYILKFWSDWADDSVVMRSLLNPPDAPPELVDYQFGPREADLRHEKEAGPEAFARGAVRSRHG